MNLVFKKTHNHICDQCNRQFDFEKGKSLYFGKLEYSTKNERNRIEKYFCSEVCASEHNKT